MSSYLALGYVHGFLIHVVSAWEAIKKNGYFRSYEESSRTFAKKHNKIKQLKTQLAELDETVGTSRKPNKNSNQTTVETSSMSSTLCADIVAELKQAMEAIEEATARRDKATEDMFQLYAKPSVRQCKVHMEQDCPGSDWCQPLHRPPRVN